MATPAGTWLRTPRRPSCATAIVAMRDTARPVAISTSLSRGAYDVAVKQIDCVCGVVVKGEDDDELWERAQEHLRSDHPELVGKVSRADILAQAEET
jgi:predicted small metal-binding protein